MRSTRAGKTTNSFQYHAHKETLDNKWNGMDIKQYIAEVTLEEEEHAKDGGQRDGPEVGVRR